MMRLRDLFSNHIKASAPLVFALILFCFAAQTARAQQDDETVRVESSVVQLNVGVVDRQGRPITNLSRNDFVIYEDDVRQSILSFEPVTTPFSLVLMLDMSGSTQSFRQMLKQSAYRFLDSLGPEDRVAVVAFNDKTAMLARFTTNRRKLADAIDLASGKGGTEFYKAMNYALEELAKEGKRRKAIVVLTDGLDTQLRSLDRAAAQNALTDEEAIASIKPEASAALNEVLNKADRQGVTIYPLALPSGDPRRLALRDATITAIYASARTRLQALANRTGGRFNAINRLEDMGRLYAEVAADMRTLYSVAYQPAGEKQRDGRWRTIRVEISPPELIARTRPGYYAR